ncbi:MAG: peptide-methionine (S)-S-oxide reductase [Cytophagales bacterium]|nr:MAG: peptide-methionine (S)-S-oxide reductase [Cytophagales bacterium]
MMRYSIICFCFVCLLACVQEGNTQSKSKKTKNQESNTQTNLENMEQATFGAGCFWCVEAVFQRINGVEKIVSGYAGGKNKNPTYKEVCTGETGHAEVCQITYDPSKVTYDELLEVFWKTHDPTTLNRQGNDEGTQYRSVVFYHNDAQKQLAEKYKKELNEVKAYDKPIVTEISLLPEFYVAEDYHQNYYNENPNQGYCAFVIAPKVEKLRKVFKEKLKKGSE